MNKILTFFLFLPILLHASEQKKLYAEYLGHVLWEHSLKDSSLDYQDVLKGFKEAAEKFPPKISHEEAFRISLELEKQEFEKQAQLNLEQSVTFLKEKSIQEGVIPIIAEKVYVKIIQNGTGEGLLAHDSGYFNLKASWFTGEAFYENSGKIEQALDVAIEGFRHGAIGMKKGEKRIIYIHPDCAYGIHHISHPNTALIVEVERMND